MATILFLAYNLPRPIVLWRRHIKGHLTNIGEMLAQQLSSNIKSELVECTIAPTLTVEEGYEERRQESKEQKEDEEPLELLNFDSEDIKNAIGLYLSITFKS